jgi:hypothetical protein
MKPRFTYHFDWDPAKAALNRSKHGVDFLVAVTAFSDPLSLTLYDSEHSETEERWVTIGRTHAGTLVVVAHTFKEHDENEATVRIISARAATGRERWQYERGQYSIHESTPMKSEYDFSGAERGKFFRKGAALELPIYLEPEVLAFFTARAREQGAAVDELLNRVLKDDIERMKAGME